MQTIKLYNADSKAISAHELMITEGRHPTNGNITWDIQLDFFGKTLIANNKYLLTHGIDEIRKAIEPLGYFILIKWCEVDAVQTGMIADMTSGQAFYKNEIMKKINKRLFRKKNFNEAVFQVLDEAAPEDVVSLEKQQQYRGGLFG